MHDAGHVARMVSMREIPVCASKTHNKPLRKPKSVWNDKKIEFRLESLLHAAYDVMKHCNANTSFSWNEISLSHSKKSVWAYPKRHPYIFDTYIYVVLSPALNITHFRIVVAAIQLIAATMYHFRAVSIYTGNTNQQIQLSWIPLRLCYKLFYNLNGT